METIVDGKKYIASISLRQDELLAPIVSEMLKECPDSLTHAGESTIDILAKLREGQEHITSLTSGDQERIDHEAIRKNIEETQKASVAIAMDMLKVQTWIYAKGYAKRILAILLVPEGEVFDESKISMREELFAVHADRETANEAINYFFQRSGVFGIGTRAFSRKVPTK
jgi:hypothetical protein